MTTNGSWAVPGRYVLQRANFVFNATDSDPVADPPEEDEAPGALLGLQVWSRLPRVTSGPVTHPSEQDLATPQAFGHVLVASARDGRLYRGSLMPCDDSEPCPLGAYRTACTTGPRSTECRPCPPTGQEGPVPDACGTFRLPATDPDAVALARVQCAVMPPGLLLRALVLICAACAGLVAVGMLRLRELYAADARKRGVVTSAATGEPSAPTPPPQEPPPRAGTLARLLRLCKGSSDVALPFPLFLSFTGCVAGTLALGLAANTCPDARVAVATVGLRALLIGSPLLAATGLWAADSVLPSLRLRGALVRAAASHGLQGLLLLALAGWRPGVLAALIPAPTVKAAAAQWKTASASAVAVDGLEAGAAASAAWAKYRQRSTALAVLAAVHAVAVDLPLAACGAVILSWASPQSPAPRSLGEALTLPSRSSAAAIAALALLLAHALGSLLALWACPPRERHPPPERPGSTSGDDWGPAGSGPGLARHQNQRRGGSKSPGEAGEAGMRGGSKSPGNKGEAGAGGDAEDDGERGSGGRVRGSLNPLVAHAGAAGTPPAPPALRATVTAADILAASVTPEGSRLGFQGLFFRAHPYLAPHAVVAAAKSPLPPAWLRLLHALEGAAAADPGAFIGVADAAAAELAAALAIQPPRCSVDGTAPGIGEAGQHGTTPPPPPLSEAWPGTEALAEEDPGLRQARRW